jgi:hypothetical protein
MTDDPLECGIWLLEVLQRVGLTYESLIVEGASLEYWDEAQVHRMVATFLQVVLHIIPPPTDCFQSNY